MMRTPMTQALSQSTPHQNVRVVPVEPKVKSAKTRELFNAGVRGNSKTGKSADPSCYNAVTVKERTVLFENQIRRDNMTKVTWSRDGDQWVCKLDLGSLGKMEARITRWDGPLGAQFNVQIRGNGIGGCGGGEPKDALARAKKMAVEGLEKAAEKYKAEFSNSNKEMSKAIFG